MEMQLAGFILTGGIGAGIIKILDTIINHFLAKKDVKTQALLALLHDRLYQACNFYIKRGWCSTEDKRNLEHLFKPYNKLGGNGTAESLYKKCLDLPIEEGGN